MKRIHNENESINQGIKLYTFNYNVTKIKYKYVFCKILTAMSYNSSSLNMLIGGQ